MNQILNNVSDSLNKLFTVLGQREKDVIARRLGLNENPRETLESIGSDLSVTRERIRQIENTAVKKLRRIGSKTEFQVLFELSEQIIKTHGGLLKESDLINKTLKNLDHSDKIETAIIQLSLEINPNIRKFKKTKVNHQAWYSKTNSESEIKDILKIAVKNLKANNKIIGKSDLIKQIKSELPNDKQDIPNEFIESTLEIDTRIKLIQEGYGLTTWRHVQPKSIKDKALIILKRVQKPMHFVDIANQIASAEFSNKQVTQQAVHNELIRYKDFVLVGRGLYALSEWGYNSGTVKDVLTEILSTLKPGDSLSKKQIVNEVLKRRIVKVGTISLNLQKYPEFERVGRAQYRLNSAK